MNNKKYIFNVVGSDRPGIIAEISKILVSNECNIKDISQDVLDGLFIGTIIVEGNEKTSKTILEKSLQNSLNKSELFIHLKQIIDSTEEVLNNKTEPFIIMLRAENRKGIIYRVSQLLADNNINITGIKMKNDEIDQGEKNALIIFEVNLPQESTINSIKAGLTKIAEELNFKFDIAHQKMFLEMNRI